MARTHHLEIDTAAGHHTIPFGTGESGCLTEILQQSHLPLNTRCGGRGLCSGCVVELLQGSLVHAASGTVLARLQIGNDTTISGTDMAFRSRKGKVPAGATQVTIVVTFVGGNNYKLAGADDLSLVLA